MTGGARRRKRPRREEPLPSLIPPRRDFRCPACGAEFVSQRELDEHRRTEHHTP